MIANFAIESYNADRAVIFGKRRTGVQRIIGLRSKVHTHTEGRFSERYKKVSCSATLEKNAKCVRFRDINYTHLRERWDEVLIPMTAGEERKAWLEACTMADLPLDWQENTPAYNDGNGNYHGPNARPYDLLGQLSHLSKRKIWQPSPKKIWCTTAVGRIVYRSGVMNKEYLSFYSFVYKLGLVKELRPDQMDMLARYFFYYVAGER